MYYNDHSTDTLICEEAAYMLEHRATIRQTAKHFERSKSVVHHDMTIRLPYINRALASEVAKLLQFNLQDRAKRGGHATRARWVRLKESDNAGENAKGA